MSAENMNDNGKLKIEIELKVELQLELLLKCAQIFAFQMKWINAVTVAAEAAAATSEATTGREAAEATVDGQQKFCLNLLLLLSVIVVAAVSWQLPTGRGKVQCVLHSSFTRTCHKNGSSLHMQLLIKFYGTSG